MGNVSMKWGARTGVGLAAALVAGGLAVVTPVALAVADTPRARLSADADGAVTVRDGFVGVPDGSSVDNPEVAADTAPVTAARAHLARYGALVAPAGDDYRADGSHRTVSGQTVVRFTQRVDGLPVVAGGVAVSLRENRELGSLLATTSDATAEGFRADAAAVTSARAGRAALAVAARAAGVDADDLDAAGAGRWVFDPALVGDSDVSGVHSVWRFEVGDGAAVRRLVLVDDQTGSVLLNADENEQLDRVVCDNNNVQRSNDIACSSGFARTESGGSSSVADVNNAFEYAGEVAAFYDEIGGLDLTQLLGISVGGTKKLAATVRWCYAGTDCPYANAFWNGSQMYYGSSYASADDVVGHEMTHGVIDQYAELFYWGQSGAMNESLADVMGEIVDHRNVNAGDSASSWSMGEDLPIGAIRDLADPTEFNDPDRMTSSLYTSDASTGYSDSGGVHTNSGVGNKTAYLISQGGSFNGQTITGIDGGDAELTKTATLYLDVIQSLTSGSDYADLAAVLDQSCENLVGSHGFTAGDCANVHKATLATELRTTPSKAGQPTDAALECPSGATPTVLFDSESGTPSSKFTAGSGWQRGSSSRWGSNATSGLDSWSDTTDFGTDDMTPTTESLTVASPITVPSGGQTYLWFQGWYVLDYGGIQGQSGTYYFDAATVEIGSGGAFADAAGLTWVNGPDKTVYASFGNPAAGRTAFGGDSRGWVASRVDLSSYAGQSIRPRFSVSYDNGYSFVGWFLDDVTVYSCDGVPQIANATKPSISGTARVGKTLTAAAGTWSPSSVSVSYQWLRNGKTITKATKQSYKLVKADQGKRISVRVTAAKTGYTEATATSGKTGKVKKR